MSTVSELFAACQAGDDDACRKLRDILVVPEVMRPIWPDWPLPGPRPFPWPFPWPWPPPPPPWELPRPQPDPPPWIIHQAMFDELVRHVTGVDRGEPNPQPSRPLAGIFDPKVRLQALRTIHSDVGQAIKELESAAKGR